MVDAKWILVFEIPNFSIGEVKNASEETPPAGKNTLAKFLFKHNTNAFDNGNLTCRALNAEIYICAKKKM